MSNTKRLRLSNTKRLRMLGVEFTKRLRMSGVEFTKRLRMSALQNALKKYSKSINGYFRVVKKRRHTEEFSQSKRGSNNRNI